MFRINNEDIRTTSISSFWYLYCYLWSYFIPFSSISIVHFEQVKVCWEVTFWMYWVQRYCIFAVDFDHVFFCWVNPFHASRFLLFSEGIERLVSWNVIENNFQLLFLSLISVEFIPITISAPIIQEPVHLLALEIHGLVSIWWEVLVDNGLIQLINYYCSESTINTLRHCA